MEPPTERAEPVDLEESLASRPVDDEPLDDEDRAALAEPWDPTTAVSLDEHFARRARAS